MIENDIEEQDAKKPQDIVDSKRASTEGESSRADRHFRTEHLMADLKGRSVRGGAVTMAGQGVKFTLQMCSTAVLARLLTPADFGLIAMVTSVVGFVAMFKDAGLSMATVQREHITHAQVSTLFWINVALSAALMLVVAALAPAIAWFYDEPRLTAITVAIAATFILGGLTVQHQALLGRQMRFKELAIIELLSMAFGIATAVILALQGWAYWALVSMTAGSAITNCALVWILSGWRPGWPVRHSGVGAMLRFGGGLTGFNFLNYFTRNADNVIIGYTLGGASLGIYAKAYSLLMMPIQQINGPVGSVMVPLLSRLQNDPERYRSAFLRAIGMLAFIGMPIIAFLFVIADEVITIVLGPGWGEATSVFRWLAPAALLGTVNVAPGWLCVSLGRAKVQVIWAAISAPVTVMAFLFGSRWGITGVAAGFSISWCILFVLFLALACHDSPVSIARLAECLLVPLLASVTAAISCFLLDWLLLDIELISIVMSLVNFSMFMSVYALVSVLFPSSRARVSSLWRDGMEILGHRRRRETE